VGFAGRGGGIGSRQGLRLAIAGAALIALCSVPALSAGATKAAGPPTGRPGKYIVVLNNQNPGLAAGSTDRTAATQSEQAPVVSQLQSVGATNITSTSIVNAVTATMTPSAATDVAGNGAVAEVVPDAVIQGPTLPTPAPTVPGHPGPTASPPCGTASSPELDPEALTNIHATPTELGSIDGAGVKVAFIADGIDTGNVDFKRNAAYASSGSPKGAAVITDYEDFSGDGTSAPTGGGEAFLDASSIAAQGNQTYDISKYVNSAHPLPTGCDIRIVGVAPGSSLLALKAFGVTDYTTSSGILQAIQYAVSHGANVINESFGGNPFPDTTADLVRQADDTAVAAGVTVVVSTGDGGVTGTIGSPATDSNVISVGATTTFRSYEQTDFGGINDPRSNGKWVDDNISSASSGGFAQDGSTLDLVAPGDQNWALCSTDTAMYTECTSFDNTSTPIEEAGGTSEASPLTAGAAADVIQAYAQTHGGNDPSPARVKQILMSTATDIQAPATQQGAGELNVAAAVTAAESIGNPAPTATPATKPAPTPSSSLLISPNQINVSQSPGQTSAQTISITNSGSSSANVQLSTRTLGPRVGDDHGSFCMQPGTPTVSCPANTGDFPIWSGVDEVYEEQSFDVPHTGQPSRLVFTADYQFTGQNSVVHVALLEPDGTYAGYSQPQGLADFADVEVANPPAGKWTAVFFTEKNGATEGGVGTSGPVQWDASTFGFSPGDQIAPGSLTIPAGATRTAELDVTSPAQSGDTSESVVVSSGDTQTSVPVTVRTIVPVGPSGGSFQGVLTGGNGRAGTQAQSNTYVFNVPSGEPELQVGVSLANDPNDQVLGYLINPDGQNIGYSTNFTTDSGGNPIATTAMNLYSLDPEAGQWRLVLQFQNPVNGTELTEPFSGTISFDQPHVNAGGLPDGGPHSQLTAGGTYTYNVTIRNPGQSPEVFYADSRLSNTTETITLPNGNGGVDDSSVPLPLPAPTATSSPVPFYLVPTNTTEIDAGLTGTVPVTFDISYAPGDPDVEATVGAGNSASATVTAPQVSPGQWPLVPDELGPFPASGAPAGTASASVSAVTESFDPNMTSSTGDLWTALNGLSATFKPVYVNPGQTATIQVSITPTGSGQVSGTLYLDDLTLASTFGLADESGQEIAAIPYSYTVKALQPQTINFPPLPDRKLSQSPVKVSATATSQLPVSFSTTTPRVCTSGGPNGSKITLRRRGACTVVANQAGNATFAAAPAVSDTFNVKR
jgi:Subtilase family